MYHLYLKFSPIIRRVLLLGLVGIPLSFSAAAVRADLQVIEMFTSQGCYSCPAADKLLAKMSANDESILNLEFHVDYWNKLQYGSEGSWVDPFSSSEYTERQRKYSALNLRGEKGVYTPQAVINGVYGHVGSNRRALKKGLKVANPRPVSVDVVQRNATTLDISIVSEPDTVGEILLVSFLKKTSTNITSGENHGKIMENHNVVVDIRVVGTLSDIDTAPLQVTYDNGDNRGCAVLVQPEGQGAILGAARCP